MEMATMVVDEDARLETIPAIAERLTGLVNDHAAVRIDIADDIRCDLSFLQLVGAVRGFAAQNDCALSLARPASPSLAALLDRAGYLAAATPADIDFWFHGETPQ